MSTVTNAALIAAGKKLLAYISTNTVQYVANGMTLAGMDCQGLLEYCLIQAGIPKSECGLAGSNAHYRTCVWRGTPEAIKKILGATPAGAALFIVDNDGAEPDKYKADGLGNASHVGLWLGNTSIAASASRGKVIESNYAGKSINGGWNMVGLLPWVDYGLTDAQKNALGIGVVSDTAAEAESVAVSAEDTTGFYTIKKGCLGGAVRRLQTWLSEAGYILSVDGDFGENTKKAVKAFQTDYNLKVDGIVGKATWAALAQARYDASVQG